MDEQHLEEMYRMVEENNSILRGMHRSALMKSVLRFLLLAAIVAGIYFVWQSYVQPVANKASETYQSTQNEIKSVQGQVQSVQKQVQSVQQSVQGVQTAASSTQSFFGGILKNLGF